MKYRESAHLGIKRKCTDKMKTRDLRGLEFLTSDIKFSCV